MKQIYDDLWQTQLEKPFGGVHTHAYFLKCEEGNVLIYNTSSESDIEQINELGGIKFQYLSHRDEIGDSLIKIRNKFGSSLCCHVYEEPIVAQTCPVDITFSEKVIHFSGIQVILTPGHTAGSLSFLYHSPNGLTYLFTGDTYYLANGKWGTLVFINAGGSYEDLINSLLIYKELSPDVVISSASTGDISYIEVARDKWKSDLDDRIKELKKRF